MNLKQIQKHPYFYPYVVAVLLHAVLIALAMWIHFSAHVEVPQEDQLRFNVKSVDAKPMLMQNNSLASNPDRNTNALRFFQSLAKSSTPLPQDVPVDSLVKKDMSAPQNSPDVAPKKMELDETDASGLPELDTLLVDAEDRQLQDKVQTSQKSSSGISEVLKMVEQHKTDAAKLVQSLKKPLEKMSLSISENINIDPEEGMPGFTPMEGTMGNSDFDQGVQESRSDILKYESLDDFLDIQVYTYQDPADSQKYYMIKIFAKKNAKQFKVMPKEILFTIDCSLSISPERLEEFKRGISTCLKNLNPDDVFNVVAFKDKAFLFSEHSVKATPETIRAAERFVSGLTSNRTTDVYGAFEKIVKTEPERRPSNVILISDGRPTHGVVDSRELISGVTRINNKVRPVFAYSGGAKVNRYLLDFLSYQNRAWSQFIKDRGQIGKGLADFYAKIKDPIFLNLRYELNNLQSQEVFPKSLPDFYRNAEFTLYGKYENEDEFSMQLLGDVDGKTKELIFTRSLAKAPKGGPDIMKGYAFNKIYHLISRVTTEGKSDALLNQIRELSGRYHVTTPYSPDLESKD